MTAEIKSGAPKFTGPLFITGMWRSGSSLLYALLNKHPRVGLMYEADLTLMREAFWFPRHKGWARRWEAWNKAMSRHSLEITNLPDARRSFHAVFEFVHKDYARRKGADIWGDKSPDLYDRMVPLSKEFPGARFIVVWRQPGATISSMQAAAAKGARFFQKDGMTLRGLLGNMILRRQCDRLIEPGVPVCEIEYEELVADTERVMRRICEFLEIPFDAAVVSLEGSHCEPLHAGEHHSLLRGDKIRAKPEAQALPVETQRKIQRYIRHWNKCRSGRWPQSWSDATLPDDAAGIAERWTDHLLYRAGRCVDGFKRLAFCLAPMNLVTRHRERKGHR